MNTDLTSYKEHERHHEPTLINVGNRSFSVIFNRIYVLKKNS